MSDYLTPVRLPTITARKKGFVWRPIATWCNGVYTDRYGTIYEGIFAVEAMRTSDGAMVVTREVGSLIALLQEFDTHPALALAARFSDSAPKDKDEPWVMKPRLVGFGWKQRRDGKRSHKRGCIVLDASRFLSSPGASAKLAGNTHQELYKLGVDIRDWCKEQDIPMRTSAAGLASALTRDSRFIGESTWRVPTATNERVREWLPGVHMEKAAPSHKRYESVWGLDQRRAYHRAAQDVPIAHPRDLYARGFYSSWKQNLSDLWLTPESESWDQLIGSHGLFIIQGHQNGKPSRWSLPVNKQAYSVGPLGGALAVWSAELPYAIEQGLTITGLYAAWVTENADESWKTYGAWAESQIDKAQPNRAIWLKPTLHARYGLSGARQRRLMVGHTFVEHDTGTRESWPIGGQRVELYGYELPAQAPATTHVVALGTLQAAIRARSLEMAHTLEERGFNVLHVHADGLHVEDTQLQLLDSAEWSTERVSNLVYRDDVSWTSDQRDVLPGRAMSDRVANVRFRTPTANNQRSSMRSLR